jgi:outer membrane protein assembly factor BamB
VYFEIQQFQREIFMLRVRLFGRIFCAASLLSVAPAFATVVNTYTDQASWFAASSGVQNVNFEGLAPTNGYGTATPSVTADGVTFAGIQGSGTYAVQPIDTSAFSYFNFGTGDALTLTSINVVTPEPFFGVSLPSNITSFGVNLFTASPQGGNARSSVESNDSRVIHSTTPFSP